MADIYLTADHPAALPLSISEKLSLEHWATPHSQVKIGDPMTSAEVQKMLGNFAVSNGQQPTRDQGEATAALPNSPNERVSDQPVLDQDHFAEVAKTVLTDAMSHSLTGQLCFDMDTLAFLLRDPKFKGEQAQALLALYQNYDQFHNLNSSLFARFETGISDDILDKFQSLEKQQTHLPKDGAEMKLVSAVLASCTSVARGAQSAGFSDNLYGPGYSLKSVSADAVKQGSANDSAFDAVVAALATSRPELLQDLISTHDDGSFAVNFPGEKGWGPNVSKPTDAELGAFNHGGKNGIWAAVLEKAYGKYQGEQSYRGESNPLQNGAESGSVESAIFLLTGNYPTKIDVANTSKKDLANRLAEAFSDHPPKAVVTSIDGDSMWKRITFRSSDRTEDNYYKNNAYTITGFSSDGRGGGTVVIRNPRGGADGTVDGTNEIPLDEFMRNFTDISII